MRRMPRSQKPDVKSRAQQPNHMYSYCRIIGCAQPARAGTTNGLDQKYCRKHADHFNRHGRHTKTSYKAAELKPFRQVVRKWLSVHREAFMVANACQRIETLYRAGGTFEEAFRLRGMTARERANKAWARLRKAGIPPERVLEAVMVVEMAVALDPAPDWRREFKHVQTAKLVHRLASGSHKKWSPNANPWASPRVAGQEMNELHVYPHSRGKVLRHIGADAEEACGLVVADHLAHLLASEAQTRRP